MLEERERSQSSQQNRDPWKETLRADQLRLYCKPSNRPIRRNLSNQEWVSYKVSPTAADDDLLDRLKTGTQKLWNMTGTASLPSVTTGAVGSSKKTPANCPICGQAPRRFEKAHVVCDAKDVPLSFDSFTEASPMWILKMCGECNRKSKPMELHTTFRSPDAQLFLFKLKYTEEEAKPDKVKRIKADFFSDEFLRLSGGLMAAVGALQVAYLESRTRFVELVPLLEESVTVLIKECQEVASLEPQLPPPPDAEEENAEVEDEEEGSSPL
eukprot:gene23161-35484_t